MDVQKKRQAIALPGGTAAFLVVCRELATALVRVASIFCDNRVAAFCRIRFPFRPPLYIALFVATLSV
jgi:hypothetical protein